MLTVCFVGMVFGSFAIAANDGSALDAIISAVKSNESNIASVQVAGTYQTTMYDAHSSMFRAERGDFRFCRYSSVIQIDMTREYWGVKDGATQQVQSNWVSIGRSINFYDPSTNIVVSPGSDTASVGEPSMPPVFPIAFGYWVRPMGSVADVRQFSRDISDGLSEHCLSVMARDPNYPNETVLEFTNSQVRVRWWIDPHRGFLVTKSSEYVPIPKSARPTGPAEVLVVEEDSSLEQTGGVWYVKNGVRKSYAPVPTSREAGELELYLQKEETIQVSEFGSLTSMKANEVEFSTNRFPYVRYFYDFMNDRTIDLKPPHHDGTNAPSS